LENQSSWGKSSVSDSCCQYSIALSDRTLCLFELGSASLLLAFDEGKMEQADASRVKFPGGKPWPAQIRPVLLPSPGRHRRLEHLIIVAEL
jgi:hypothetical protein